MISPYFFRYRFEVIYVKYGFCVTPYSSTYVHSFLFAIDIFWLHLLHQLSHVLNKSFFSFTHNVFIYAVEESVVLHHLILLSSDSLCSHGSLSLSDVLQILVIAIAKLAAIISMTLSNYKRETSKSN